MKRKIIIGVCIMLLLVSIVYGLGDPQIGGGEGGTELTEKETTLEDGRIMREVYSSKEGGKIISRFFYDSNRKLIELEIFIYEGDNLKTKVFKDGPTLMVTSSEEYRYKDDNLDKTTFKDANGNIIRFEYYVYENGNLKEKAVYTPKGEVKSKEFYDDNERIKSKAFYDVKGNVKSKAFYEDGKLKSKDFYDAKGYVKSKKLYDSEGKLSAKEVYKDGKIRTRFDYEKGEFILVTDFEYDSKGRVTKKTYREDYTMKETILDDGRIMREFYDPKEDGKLRSRSFLDSDGNLIELETFIYEGDNLKFKEVRDSSRKLITRWLFDTETTDLLAKESYEDEKLSTKEFYYDNKKVKSKEFYEDGKIKKTIYNDANGNLIKYEMYTYEDGKIKKTIYNDANGNLIKYEMYTYEDGKIKFKDTKDDLGILQSRAFYDPDEQFVSRIDFEYDSRGRTFTEKTYLAQEGGKLLSTIKFEYYDKKDEKGNYIIIIKSRETIDFGAEGILGSTKNVFDEKGKLKEEIVTDYFDGELRRIRIDRYENDERIGSSELEFDELGQTITNYYDKNNVLWKRDIMMPDNLGRAVEYLEDGKVVAAVIFSGDGKTLTVEIGNKKIEYDQIKNIDFKYFLVKDKEGNEVILDLRGVGTADLEPSKFNKNYVVKLPAEFEIDGKTKKAISTGEYFTLVGEGIIPLTKDGKPLEVGYNKETKVYYIAGTGKLKGKAKIIGFRVDLGSGSYVYVKHGPGSKEDFEKLKAAGLLDKDITLDAWKKSRQFDPDTGEPEGIWVDPDTGYILKDGKFLTDFVYYGKDVLTKCPGLGLGYDIWCKGNTYVKRVAGKLEDIEFVGFEKVLGKKTDEITPKEIADYIHNKRQLQDAFATLIKGPRTAVGKSFSDYFNHDIMFNEYNKFFQRNMFGSKFARWFFQPETWEEQICEGWPTSVRKPENALFGFNSDGVEELTMTLQAEFEDFTTGFDESTGDAITETLYQVSWLVKNINEDSSMLYTICANRCDSSCILVSESYTDKKINPREQDSGFRTFYFAPGINTMSMCYVELDKEGKQITPLQAFTVPVVSENYQPSDLPIFGQTSGGSAPAQSSIPRGAGSAITP